jgi:hypothetical protein
LELPTGDISTSRRYVSAEQIEDVVRQLKDVVSDYKKISIAQIQGRAPLAGGGTPGVSRLGFSDVALTVNGSRAEATVHLRREDTLYTGSAVGHASGYNQLRLIATAAIRAVEDSGSEDGTMVVEDLQTDIPLAGRKSVMVLVSALGSAKGEELLTGCALIRQDAWKAVVSATLDAVNRRVSLAFLEEEF